jgi:hypothetical protein
VGPSARQFAGHDVEFARRRRSPPVAAGHRRRPGFGFHQGQAAAAPFTELVFIAYVSAPKAIASLLRSSTSLLLFENVSQAWW